MRSWHGGHGPMIDRMHEDLTPLRRAQELFDRDRPSNEIVDELRVLFGLDTVAAPCGVRSSIHDRARRCDCTTGVRTSLYGAALPAQHLNLLGSPHRNCAVTVV